MWPSASARHRADYYPAESHINVVNHMTAPNFAQLPDTTADPPTADLYSVRTKYFVRTPYRVVLSAPAQELSAAPFRLRLEGVDSVRLAVIMEPTDRGI